MTTAPPNKKSSTNAQKALGWIICRSLADQINAQQQNNHFTADDIHDYFLMERHGTIEKTLYGRVMIRPAKTFSKMTCSEMVDMIDHIMRRAAAMGLSVSIPANHSYWQLAQDMGL